MHPSRGVGNATGPRLDGRRARREPCLHDTVRSPAQRGLPRPSIRRPSVPSPPLPPARAARVRRRRGRRRRAAGPGPRPRGAVSRRCAASTRARGPAPSTGRVARSSRTGSARSPGCSGPGARTSGTRSAPGVSTPRRRSGTRSATTAGSTSAPAPAHRRPMPPSPRAAAAWRRSPRPCRVAPSTWPSPGAPSPRCAGRRSPSSAARRRLRRLRLRPSRHGPLPQRGRVGTGVVGSTEQRVGSFADALRRGRSQSPAAVPAASRSRR